MSTSPSPADARAAMATWRATTTGDPFGSDRHLIALMETTLAGARLADIDAIGRDFGLRLAAVVGPAVQRYRAHPPALEKFDGLGNRVERVTFTADYDVAGTVLWDVGLVARSAAAGGSYEQFVLGYLASTEGEMGHMCPAVCTTGMVRALRRAAEPTVAERFLPRLTDSDYAKAWRGAQFLTEVQGGSDVGANVVAAVPQGDGTYRITGEKWFCSVADADVFLVTARPAGAPDGTGGLGCFVIPRLVDGMPNGFSIRRLKDKLGTTSMASGEIDFENALAYPVGDVAEGFKVMVSAMLNTSRWMNAIGNAGMMRRAYVEAAGYATYRMAFGRPIGEFPLVRRQLAMTKARSLAALHSTWALTGLDEVVDVAAMGGAEAASDDVAFHRFLVNANKLVCSLDSTDVVRDAIEILGGNGAIEDFSVLPRLLRDSVVYEQWEGTHNTLTAQVRRDMAKLGLGGVVVDRIATMLKSIGDPRRGAVAQVAEAALEGLVGRITRSVEEPAYGELHFRAHLIDLVRTFQVAHMLGVAESTGDEAITDELTAAAGLLANAYLNPAYTAGDDPSFLDEVDACLGDDLAR